ncbi:zinc-binding alcohol dehydrogenase [Nocardiopsis sp. RSe5-2]|uniref:Zinc-binding alcohol dehydrogenase n=1 Tax=Nocardiopsis endophytica TaxID=3018445 RepID=A0ABT4TZN1_9ACTN|nr:zinc-binding alcohol dehydrogenase [Nocardiopsis endophytica]MDA2810161.1 zinc-binding alcohol dehydrogenase [Nocardiopsis endophytica]
MERTARAFWVTAPGRGEIRSAALPEPGDGDVVVRTLYTGVSRGTEALVFGGRVPDSLKEDMRAPHQEGEFPGPVKYGYLNSGVVEQGPPELVGREVFCLYPHQTRYVVPAEAVVPLPPGVPARRAVLAGAVETAVNALWDAAPRVGDRVCVVGAGMVGCCVARMLSSLPGVRLQLVDTDPSRARAAERLGVPFAAPDAAEDGCDLVFHTSASEEGLGLSLGLLGTEGEVIELSWYGDRQVRVPLGEAFHPRRLAVRCSQVGRVSPARRARRTLRDRLTLAVGLLADPAYDALITGESPFEELPATMPGLADGGIPALCHAIAYP